MPAANMSAAVQVLDAENVQVVLFGPSRAELEAIHQHAAGCFDPEMPGVPKMSGLVLHVGVGKTGTASLQRQVFARHSGICYLGKSLEFPGTRGCVSEDVFEALAPLLWSPKRTAPAGQLKEAVEAAVFSRARPGQAVVASWEGLGTLSPRDFRELLQRLLAINPGLRILMCLRNPLDWAPSMYLQAVQGQYLRQNRNLEFLGRPFVNLHRWLTIKTWMMSGLEGWLIHAVNARTAIEMLGPENVGIVLFEHLRTDPDSYYRQVAEFLGVNASETLELAHGKHVNRRLLQTQLDFIESSAAHFGLRREWRQLSEKDRHLRLQSSASHSREQTPARVRLDDHWQTRIVAEMQASYGWLDRELKLRLSEYGYP